MKNRALRNKAKIGLDLLHIINQMHKHAISFFLFWHSWSKYSYVKHLQTWPKTHSRKSLLKVECILTPSCEVTMPIISRRIIFLGIRPFLSFSKNASNLRNALHFLTWKNAGRRFWLNKETVIEMRQVQSLFEQKRKK